MEACIEEACPPCKVVDIADWLDGLRPGWAARFAPAFERLGLTEIAQLSSADLKVLERELQAQGARLVHIKQFRQAIDSISNGEEGNINFYESPCAAYFGESSNDLMSFLHDGSPLALNSYFSPNVEWSCSSTQAPVELPVHASTKTSFFKQCCDMPNKSCSESGLPFKSPMSAFFDGDADFHLPCPPEASVPSPMDMPLVSPCFIARGFAPTVGVSFSLQSPRQGAGQQHASCAPGLIKSALRTSPKHIGCHVSWADEASKKALSLNELIDAHAPMKYSLAQRVWQLSQHAQGTFEVQRVLEEGSVEERLALVFELRGHVFEATQCPHANHVLRKVITVMEPLALNFVVVELMSKGPGTINEIARHRYGCRILEGLFMRCRVKQLSGMVECLLKEAYSLCMHKYGNFVMQCLFQHLTPSVHSQVLGVIHANLTAMAMNFYGSAVVAKALLHGSHTGRLLITREILDVSGLLAAIARYRHGKAIVEIVLATLEGSEKEAAMHQLAAPPLKVPKSSRC